MVIFRFLRQATYLILKQRGFTGDRVMKFMRALIMAAICCMLFSSATGPAFAWFWPILGDAGPCPGSPFVGGPSPILPGTPEWALQPTYGARLFPFGYPYGVIHGGLNFGVTPPFGFSRPGASSTISFDGYGLKG